MNGDSVATTSLSLIERVQANDAAAWARLQELYAPLVVQWCRWAKVRDEDIADIGQDVFLAVTRNIQRFSKAGAGQSFRGWLRTITNSKIIDAHRARGLGPRAEGGTDAQLFMALVPQEQSSVEPAEPRVSEETAILYRRAMELIARDFPAWYGEAVWALLVDERSPDEVAEQNQVRISAVYNAKARVLRRLREEFAELMD
jgi:RNA polymerase sigma-70 factor (ECF subfamily)